MNKVFKNHFSLCAFTTAVIFFVSNVDAQVKAVVSGNVQNGKNYFSCDKSASFYRCNDGREHSISRKTYQKTGEHNAEEAAIEASKYKTKIIGSDITIQGGANSGSLNKSSWKYGVAARQWGVVNILTGAIDFTNAVGVHASGRGDVYLTSVSITDNSSQATNVDNNSENSAFQISEDLGYIRFDTGNVKVSNAHGISFMGIAGGIDIRNSTVVVEGNTSYGVFLFDKQERQYGKDIEERYKSKEAYSWQKGPLSNSLPRGEVLKRGGVGLHGGSFTVPNSVAIYSKKSGGSITLREGATLSGDLLLKVEDSSFVKVVVQERGSLVGGVRIDESSDAQFELMEKSKWTLTRPKNKDLQDLDSIGVSSISLIDLIDSSIFFAKPDSSEDSKYQTLRIGRGKGTVYRTEGISKIYFNADLISRDTDSAQVSDRLLIHGNVDGKTMVHVNSVSDDTSSKQNGSQNKSYSVSIIQVFGEAKRDSFQLEHGYITLDGLPYKYVLRAYGPEISPRMPYFDKTLIKGSTTVWDFRLESENFVPLIPVYTVPAYSLENEVSETENGVSETPESGASETPGSGGSQTPESGVSGTQGSGASETPGSGGSQTPESVVSETHESSPRLDSSSIVSQSKQEDSTSEIQGSGASETPGSGGSQTPESVVSETLKNVVSETHESSPRLDSSSIVSQSKQEDSTSEIQGSGASETPGSGGSQTPESGVSGTQGSGASETPGSGGSQTPESVVSETLKNVVSETHESSPRLDSSSIVSQSKQEDSTSEIQGSGASETPGSGGSQTPESVVSETLKNVVSETHESSPRLDSSSIASQSKQEDVISTTSKETKPETPPIRVHIPREPAPIILSAAPKSDVSIASQCDDAKGSKTVYSCNDGESHTITNLKLVATDEEQRSVHAKNENTVMKLEGVTISGAHGFKKANVDLTTLQPVSTVLAEDGAEVVLDKKSAIKFSLIGLEAQRGGKVKINDGTVDVQYVGVLAGSGSSVALSDTIITVRGDLAVAGLASNAGEINMKSGAISLSSGVAVRSELGGRVKLNKVSITARKDIAKKGQGQSDATERFGSAAFMLSNNGSVDFVEGTVTTDANALWIRDGDGNINQGSSRRRRSSDVRPSMNHANIEFSNIKVESDNSYGIYFDGAGRQVVDQQSQNKIPEKIVSGSSVEDSGTGSLVKRSAVRPQEKAPVSITGAVTLKRTNFEVLKSIAIYGNNSGGRVSLENKTTLAGDLLLGAENNSHMLVSVDSSYIVGGARVDKTSYAKLDLTNRSEWHLTRSARKNWRAPDSECVDSCVSSVSLVDSSIDFTPSQSEELEYQTLRIGEGKGLVYKAQGDVSIHFNARLNPNDPSDRQVSDRLVIHGDVEGKTVVSVRSVSGSVGENNGSDKTAHSVSVIQVYGKAEKDSFRLDRDYVALGNSPYKYTLRSYSPEMTSKQEHVQQKFMKDGGEFWNFRLENQYVKSESFDANIISKADTISLPRKVVRSVVPQVPTYLLLPNSVFHAGLMDISNQNKQLEALRTTSSGMVEIRENPALYLRGYSGSYRYASDLTALEYGYGGDLSYNGVEAGVLLKTIENADNAISFGVMGSYGKLSLQPQDVEQSQESAFDKWTATAYGSLQHETGLYVDGLLSYGLFKGDVVTLARGKTATLKGNPLSVSLTGGQTFVTGYEGFVFDPQVQVVYQHLQFSKARDIDNFDIELGKLDQWVARVGGRLSKVPTGSEGVNAVAFYGKLYFAHGFGGNKSVYFKDAFQLGAFGSSLEAGLGFNAKLSSQFSLHGDVVYQHKLNKAGFSGTSFSGGIRYQF